MREKKTFFKITYNGLRIFWILIYLVYMFFYGFTSYNAIKENLVSRTTYLVNLFDTLYNQNAIQMVSNPENFKRVVVSDIEGEILLQYGELIPALTNFEYNEIYKQIKTDKIVLSDFYYDPLIDETCFDMGIIEKNRVYVGTQTAQEFLKDNLENLELDHFLMFDSNYNGFIFQNNDILPINYFEKGQINWITSSLFLVDSTMYLSHWEQLNNFHYITYIPFVKEILPLFIYSIIPFGLGLLTIFLIENMEKKDSKKKRKETEKQLSYILKNNKVPDSLKDVDDFNYDLFKQLNEKFLDYEKNKGIMKRYVEKLSLYSEQLVEIKNDLEYLEKDFYNLMNQENFDFFDSIKKLFCITFEKTEPNNSLFLKINDQTIYKKEAEKDSNRLSVNDLKLCNTLELGKHTINYSVDFSPSRTAEFSDIRKTLFELSSRYIALIYSVKKGLNPAELSLTKNFTIFSEMVNREIEKVKRYDEKGMLLYFEMLNYSIIKDKYGVSVAKIILKRISEIIISKVRTSDIVGIYREGTFLIYFCNLEENDAKIKIEKICEKIFNDEKIKQIGINIELKNLIISVDNKTKDFDDLLFKCLQTEKN